MRHNKGFKLLYGSGEKNVDLIWKTKDFYYIKTDRLFQDMNIKMDNLQFQFNIQNLEQKYTNEKRYIIYKVKQVYDNVIKICVYYNNKNINKKIQIKDIIEQVDKYNITIDQKLIKKVLRKFQRAQEEVDFLLCKDIKQFMNEQFKIWISQHIFNNYRLIFNNYYQLIKVENKIINFIARFQNRLVQLWNEPKFVLNSNYVITLDRIINQVKNLELIDKILNHKNIDEQINEWKELGIIDNSFDKNDIYEDTILGKQLNSKYKYLPIDTKYFKDLEIEILKLFDNLDYSLDGWIIKSENYQALNTILPKFKEKAQTIYIDPPFNTGSDFVYLDKYQNSSWLSLMENRLNISRYFLKETGGLFLHLDYNANYYGRILLDSLYGDYNFRNEIIWKRLTYKQTQVKGFGVIHDDIFYYTKTDNYVWKNIRINYDYNQIKKYFCWLETPEGNNIKLSKNQIDGNEPLPVGRRFALNPLINLNPDRPNLRYELFGFTRTWKYSKDKMDEYIKQGKVFQPSKDSLPQIKQYLDESEGMKLNDLWLDISGVMGGSNEYQRFETQKPENLLKRIIESTSNESNLVMDFFLGSGTTTAVAHKLGRKWIGIEMGKHFHSIILSRQKEVLACKGNHEPCGITKDVDWQGGGFFKYYELEQYEDSLKRLLDENYRLQNIDIAETLSNIKGQYIKKITKNYVEFDDGQIINLNENLI